MTSLEGIRSNCGDFLPGTEPRLSNPVSNTVASNYVVQPQEEVPVFQLPVIPVPPPIRRPVYNPTSVPDYIIPDYYIKDDPDPGVVPGGSPERIRPGNYLLELETAATELQNTNSVPPTYTPNLLLTTELQSLPSTVYAPDPNFYNTSAAPNTVLVENTRYLNILSPLVAYEVIVILNKENSTSPWSEFEINNLTDSKVAISLNKNLLVAFNNIHNGFNTKIPSNVFYKVVKKHLLEGTLSEFDPQVYIDAYQRQLGDVLVQPPFPTQVFPPIISNEVVQLQLQNPNYEVNNVVNTPPSTIPNTVEVNNAFIRMRFLPEDIGTYVSVLQSDGQLYQLPVTNSGIPTQQININV